MQTTFEVLAEPSRRKILDLLRERPRRVGELVELVGMSQPGVSKHLRVLRDASLVGVRRDAQRRWYELRPEPLSEIEAWLEPYRELWARPSRRARAAPRREGRAMNANSIERLADGVLETRDDGRQVIRFERRIGHPIERVWDALTRPEEMIALVGAGRGRAGRGRALRGPLAQQRRRGQRRGHVRDR